MNATRERPTSFLPEEIISSKTRTTSRKPRRHVVYAAHPVVSYGTAWERRQLEALAAHFPNSEIVSPSYTDDADWLARWPEVLDRLDLVVVFGDGGGWIGAGVLREVVDAIGANTAVVALDADGTLRMFGGIVDVYGGVNIRRARVGHLVYGTELQSHWLDGSLPPGYEEYVAAKRAARTSMPNAVAVAS